MQNCTEKKNVGTRIRLPPERDARVRSFFFFSLFKKGFVLKDLYKNQYLTYAILKKISVTPAMLINNKLHIPNLFLASSLDPTPVITKLGSIPSQIDADSFATRPFAPDGIRRTFLGNGMFHHWGFPCRDGSNRTVRIYIHQSGQSPLQIPQQHQLNPPTTRL